MVNIIKTVVFDFDGVLAESVDVKTAAFAKLFEHEGEDIVKKVVEYHIEHGGISRFEKFRYYYKELLCKELTSEKERELGRRFSSLVVEEVINAEMVEGAQEALDELVGKYPLFVASGTPEDELVQIISKRGLQRYFKGVYGAPTTKDMILRRIMEERGLEPNQVVMVGDAMTDYSAAVATGTWFIGRSRPGEGFFDDKDVPVLPDLKGLNSVISEINVNMAHNE